jgi:hypothetical protein
MNDEDAPENMRLRAAIALMRMTSEQTGKKEERQQEAEQAAVGALAPARAPKVVQIKPDAA